MSLAIRFSQAGKSIEISSKTRDAETCHTLPDQISQPVDPSIQSYFTCMLFAPCNSPCNHRSNEIIELTLENDSVNWLVELIITALRLGDTKARCRAATLLGMIGGARAREELERSFDDYSPDVHWAVVSALQKMSRNRR